MTYDPYDISTTTETSFNEIQKKKKKLGGKKTAACQYK